MVAGWRSGNSVNHVDDVQLRRARLVLGSVTTLADLPFRYFPGHSGPLSLVIPLWVGVISNGPSKLRGCAAAHLTRKRHAALFNCRAVIFFCHMRDMHLMGIKPLDCTFVWRVETGCRSSDIRQVSHETEFVVVLGDIREKIQEHRHKYVPLKHYTFPRTQKKNQREH